MRIAFYSHYFTPEIGAPSARIYDLAQQWISSGHTVQVVTCFPNHPTGRLYPGYDSRLYMSEELNGITVHRHWTYITPNKGFLKKTLGHITYWPAARLLSDRHLTAADVAIGTSPTFFAAMAAANRAKRCGIPFVMEIRDLWPAIFIELGILKNRQLIRALEQWEMALYRRATRIVTVTNSFRSALVARGVPPEKIATIPNGADVDFWHSADSPNQLRGRLELEGKFIVLYIGAHGISHALARIIEAAEFLRDTPDIAFLFVGEGAEKAQLVRTATDKGLDNVRFLDPVGKADVKSFYALADVCLVPLRKIRLFDTFIPSKMFEIMAAARPILASVRGESAEILSKSQGAVIVAPEDSRAIAEAILYLRGNPEARRQLGENGRRFVSSHYSRRALAEQYSHVVDDAVAAHARRKK